MPSIARRRKWQHKVGPYRLILGAILPLLSALPARAEYRVEPGDVIEIAVAGVPQLQRRVSVKLDGTITFPMLGTVAVAGMSSAQLEAKVQASLASKPFLQNTPEGRQVEVVIDPEEVTATTVEYRPIYVGGDVEKPGEYPYRAFMTVRQAIAMSGGFVRLKTTNPFWDSADLRSEYVSLWAAVAKERARIWRVNSELEGNDQDGKDTLMHNIPLPRRMVSEIMDLEAEQLKAHREDHDRQRAFLERAIKTGQEQISVLSEQQRKEEQGVRADTEELQKFIYLFGKGAIAGPRVTDARRAVLLSSTRKLQTDSQLMSTKRQQDELSREIEKLDDKRRIDLLQELQEARARLTDLDAKLNGVRDKLKYTAARLDYGLGGEVQPQLAIFRKEDDARERLVANDDTELKPGDVVDVVLQLEETSMPGTAARSERQTNGTTAPLQEWTRALATESPEASTKRTARETGAAASAGRGR